jgi:hypothetical protein
MKQPKTWFWKRYESFRDSKYLLSIRLFLNFETGPEYALAGTRTILSLWCTRGCYHAAFQWFSKTVPDAHAFSMSLQVVSLESVYIQRRTNNKQRGDQSASYTMPFAKNEPPPQTIRELQAYMYRKIRKFPECSWSGTKSGLTKNAKYRWSTGLRTLIIPMLTWKLCRKQDKDQKESHGTGEKESSSSETDHERVESGSW